MREILNLIERYEAALQEKASLEEAQKRNSEQLASIRDELAEQMLDEDLPKLEHGGVTYSVTPKTRYSKRSDDALAASGIDFFDVLRAEGLDGIIRETVNAQTLQAAISSYVEENGELSDELSECVNVYEYNDISRRKASVRGKK